MSEYASYIEQSAFEDGLSVGRAEAKQSIRKLQAQVEQLIKDWGTERSVFVKQIAKLQAQLRDIALMAKPVAATARNTSAVRTGHELGGYTKHYIIPTHLITAAKAAIKGDK